MPASLHPLLTAFLKEEPLGVSLIGLTAFLLFGYYLRDDRTEASALRLWGTRIVGSLGKALVFIGLNVLVYVFLNLQYQSFATVYGGTSRPNSPIQSAWVGERSTWTYWPRQRELVVQQFIDTESVEAIPSDDPLQKPLYKTVTVSEEVPQNSIVSFKGVLDVSVVDVREYERGIGGFNRYEADARYEYGVINFLSEPTRASFTYPFSSGRPCLENVQVLYNGEDITYKTRTDSDGITWERTLQPGVENTVMILYHFKGMEGYSYDVPFREVLDFEMVIRPNTRNLYFIADPQAGPFKVYWTGKREVTVGLKRAVLSPSVGFFLEQKSGPYGPHEQLIDYLKFIPRAILLMSCVFVLTVLIFGGTIHIRHYVILAFLQVAGMLIMMGVGPSIADFQKLALWIGIGSVLVAIFVLRGVPWLPRLLIAGWMVFFTAYYPFHVLANDMTKRNSFESIVLVVLIAYVFVFTLARQIWVKSKRDEIVVE